MNQNTNEGPETLEQPTKHVRTDKAAPKAKKPAAKKDAPKKAPVAAKKPVFGIHCGRVVEKDGERVYQIDKTESDTLEGALKVMGTFVAKFAGKDLRELIISFPKIRKAK